MNVTRELPAFEACPDADSVIAARDIYRMLVMFGLDRENGVTMIFEVDMADHDRLFVRG